MSVDLNKVMIIGRLTADPESRTTPQGTPVCTFSVATGFSWKDTNGQLQSKTEFHNVVAWRKLAEICGQYLKKAKKVYIEGRLQTRSWADPQGVKKYRTEIVADNMIMLDGKQDGGGAPRPMQTDAPAAPEPSPEMAQEDTIKVEDIPF